MGKFIDVFSHSQLQSERSWGGGGRDTGRLFSPLRRKAVKNTWCAFVFSDNRPTLLGGELCFPHLLLSSQSWGRSQLGQKNWQWQGWGKVRKPVCRAFSKSPKPLSTSPLDENLLHTWPYASVSYTFSPRVLTMTLSNSHHYSHFTDEETEPQKS